MLPWAALFGNIQMTLHSGRFTLLFPLLRPRGPPSRLWCVAGAWGPSGCRLALGLMSNSASRVFCSCGGGEIHVSGDSSKRWLTLFCGTHNVGSAWLTTVRWLIASLTPTMTTYYGRHAHARVAPIDGSGSLPSSPTNLIF